LLLLLWLTPLLGSVPLGTAGLRWLESAHDALLDNFFRTGCRCAEDELQPLAAG
jgi:hypothetical protein